MVLLNESNVSNFLWVNSWNIQIHTSVLSSDCLILSLSQCYGFTLTLSSSLVCFAGVGTRNYYRKMGYELEGPYMVKDLYGPGMDWTWTVFIWTVFFFLLFIKAIFSGFSFWSSETFSVSCIRGDNGWIFSLGQCFFITRTPDDAVASSLCYADKETLWV